MKGLRAGRYEEAIKAYDEALKINPQDADAWTNKGNALSNLGRKEEAIKQVVLKSSKSGALLS